MPSAETAVPLATEAELELELEPEPADPEPEPETADPEPEPETAAEPVVASADSEPPSADPEGPVPGDDLVAVLRGVPRYHQPDCVLIRFLPESDVQRLPVAQAKSDGCTPCAACQPAG